MLIKSLIQIKKKQSGRDSHGHVSTRHRGGEQKRYFRLIDIKRNKIDIPGKSWLLNMTPIGLPVIALIHYPDGDRRYILATTNLKIGDSVISSQNPPIKDGIPYSEKYPSWCAIP